MARPQKFHRHTGAKASRWEVVCFILYFIIIFYDLSLKFLAMVSCFGCPAGIVQVLHNGLGLGLGPGSCTTLVQLCGHPIHETRAEFLASDVTCCCILYTEVLSP